MTTITIPEYASGPLYWRLFVYLRDNHTCQECGATDHLEAHHINPAEDLRLLVSNGVTLCSRCHIDKREKKSYIKANGVAYQNLLLRLSDELKRSLKKEADRKGMTLNGLCVSIFWEHFEKPVRPEHINSKPPIDDTMPYLGQF